MEMKQTTSLTLFSQNERETLPDSLHPTDAHDQSYYKNLLYGMCSQLVSGHQYLVHRTKTAFA